ncbi:MAG: hypothetical protein ACYTF0_04480 [Planctomycetota bacterium]|jgi:hypothetical protein
MAITYHLITALCLSCALLGSDLGPGLHTDIACVTDRAYSYDLLLPDAYAEEPDRDFPVFFLSSPGGNPSVKRYRDWANSHDFIVVALNESKNGPWKPIIDNQDHTLASLKHSGVRMHPCLKYAGGTSGGAWASIRFLQRYPQEFAGVIISAHSGSGDHVAPHHAVYIYAGRNDQTHGFNHVRQAIGHYQSAGNPLRTEIHDNGHKGADHTQMMAIIEWLHQETLFTHPALSRDDLLANLDLIKNEIDALSTAGDHSTTQAAAERYLAIAAVAKSPLAEPLAASWHESVQAQAQSSDDSERFWLLYHASEQPWFKLVDKEDQRAISKEVKTLCRQRIYKDEIKAYQAYRKIETLAASGKHDDGTITKAYQQLASKMPDTRYGQLAAQH